MQERDDQGKFAGRTGGGEQRHAKWQKAREQAESRTTEREAKSAERRTALEERQKQQSERQRTNDDLQTALNALKERWRR
jgi:hypothetical protein